MSPKDGTLLIVIGFFTGLIACAFADWHADKKYIRRKP